MSSLLSRECNAHKILVLDRDGVINEDKPDYVKSPEEWHAIEGSLEAIAMLYRDNWTIVIATNQSAIGRGIIDVSMLNCIHAKMHRCAVEAGGYIDAIFFCPHAPSANCTCRKPQPGLLLSIATRYRVPAKQLIYVGDHLRDLQAISAVEGLPVLVRTGKGKKTESGGQLPLGTIIFDNLYEVAKWLWAREHEI